MSDVQKYIANRKKKDPDFAAGFEEGYREFEIGVLLRDRQEITDQFLRDPMG